MRFIPQTKWRMQITKSVARHRDKISLLTKTRHRCLVTLGAVFVYFNSTVYAYADTEQKIEAAACLKIFASDPSNYEQRLIASPTSTALHLNYADALKGDRQWDRAINEYQAVIKRRPNNTEAVLGLANTYALDHDYGEADKLYEQAQKMWPGDSSVQQSTYDFQRQRNPRLYLFWESDLSFKTSQGGFIVPFAAREEIGVDYQEETSIAPALNDTKIYTRSDSKIFYTHYFGRNHMLDFSARASEYEHFVPDTDLGYSAIDTYEEYRARYTLPLTLEHVFAVRYTARPTILKLSQDNFTAHKLELELNTRWVPRLSTLLGGGWLRDLDSNAVTATHLTNRSLVKIGFQWDATTLAWARSTSPTPISTTP